MACGVFLCGWKISFLKTICTQCVLSASLVHSFLGRFPRIIIPMMSDKKCCTLHWIEKDFSRKKLNKIRVTILPWYKQVLPSYHDVVEGCRSYLKSIVYSLISLPWKFESDVYHSFRENKFERDQSAER